MKTILKSRDASGRREFLSTLIACASAAVFERVALADQRGAEPPHQTRAEVLADLVVANRILAAEGIVDGFGHISVRVPGATDRFLLSKSVAPALVTSVDVMEYDLDARPIDARGRPSYQERFIHSEIYRVRRDA